MGLFREPALIDGDEDMGSMAKALVPRRSVTVVSIPGWTPWARAAFGPQAIDSAEVVIYDDADGQRLHIGSACELYGVLESGQDGGPHCLHLVAALPPPAGLHYGRASPAAQPDGTADSVRSSLLGHMAQALGGSEAAARLLLAHLVSTVAERKVGLASSLLIGHFPLCLAVSDPAHAAILTELIAQLRPAVATVAIGAAQLDAVQLAPSVEADSGAVARGLLQLAPGTHLVLDETALEAGQFSARATANLKAVMELLDHQHVSFDLGFQSVQIRTDYTVLSVAVGSSIFSHQWTVPVSARELPAADAPSLARWRSYLEACRGCAVAIAPDTAERLEQEYVSRRQGQADEAFDENRFAALLNLARLLGKSRGAAQLAMADWDEAVALSAHLSTKA